MQQVSFDPIIAEAYRQASLEGWDMYAFASQMERVKTAVQLESDLYKQWERLDDLIGSILTGGDDPKQIQLVRQVFVDSLEDLMSNVVLEPGGKDSEDWLRWLKTFSEASFNWRLDALHALCHAPALEQRFGDKLEPYQQCVRSFKDRRWVETRAVFQQLAADKNLPEEQRGYHNYVCGQIDLYFHYQYEQALSLFEKASKQLSGKPLAFHGLIEYYLKGPEKVKDLDLALELAEKALVLDPDDVPSIIEKADVLSGKDLLDEAENLYRLGSQKRPGNMLCYTRLIDLYGKPALFETKESELASLLEIDVNLDPTTNFLTRTDLGSIYQSQDERFWEKAEQYHQDAVDQYPEGIMAALNLGYFYLDVTKAYEKARPIFEDVIERAPEAREGYLAKARLHEALKEWAPAIAQYEKVQAIIPSWDRFMEATIGRCQRQLGQYDAAEKALLKAWKQDAYDDSGALAELYELAQKWYKNAENPQPERAIKLLERATALHTGSADTAAGLANRQGHVYFYVERYAEALPYYRQAAGLDATEVVYYTNQFDCLDKLYRETHDEQYFDQAMEALDQAAAVAPKDSTIPKKRRQLALIHYNPHLATLPTLHQVHIEVGQPLISQVTEDYKSLLPEITELTDALRARMTDLFAITLPGLRYRDISAGGGAYQFRLYETPVVLDQLEVSENNPPTMAAVLEKLEQFIRNYCLDLFVNYWDVDKEVPLLPNDELVHFTRVVMALLAEQIPLPALPELHQHYRQMDANRYPVADVVEQLRLLSAIQENLPGKQDGFQYIHLGKEEERLLEACLVGTGDVRALALPVTYAPLFLDAVVRLEQKYLGQKIALVTESAALRPCLRSIFSGLPHIPILKSKELPPDAEQRTLTPLVFEGHEMEVFLKAKEQLQSMNASDINPPQL